MALTTNNAANKPFSRRNDLNVQTGRHTEGDRRVIRRGKHADRS